MKEKGELEISVSVNVEVILCIDIIIILIKEMIWRNEKNWEKVKYVENTFVFKYILFWRFVFECL